MNGDWQFLDTANQKVCLFCRFVQNRFLFNYISIYGGKSDAITENASSDHLGIAMRIP